MDEAYREALRRYIFDPSDHNFKALANIYRRLRPDMRITATLYPLAIDEEGYLEDDNENPMWGSKYDVTEKILDMPLESALNIFDSDYESLILIPNEIMSEHCAIRCDVLVRKSIWEYMQNILDGGLYCKDPECSTSTGIHGGLTHGKGDLSDYGFWEFSCHYFHKVDEVFDGEDDV